MLARLLTITALVAAVAVAPPAQAADPAPAPCADTLYTDPVGDQLQDPVGFGEPDFPTVEKGQDNTDIKSVFLNYATDADGKQVLTANLKIANLTKEIPDVASGGIYYYLSYNLGDVPSFVSARLTSSGITYNYGHLATIPPDPAPIGLFTAYTVDGQTTGSFVEGADGVVSIVVPEAAGGKAGESLGAAVATVDLVQIDDEKGYQSHADSAPDDSDTAKDVTVTACPATGGTTVTSPVTEVVTATVETTTTTAPAAATLTTLPFKAASVLGSAKKAAKKGLAFKVTTTSAISGLVLQLKSRGKTVAKLKVASLKQGTSTLRMKARKLKAGSYKLVASGTVDGQALTTSQAVKVRK
jgi:hypothetical protein